MRFADRSRSLSPLLAAIALGAVSPASAEEKMETDPIVLTVYTDYV